MHLTLLYIVFVCHQKSIGSIYTGGYCGLSVSGLCVFGKLCPVGFLAFYSRVVISGDDG